MPQVKLPAGNQPYWKRVILSQGFDSRTEGQGLEWEVYFLTAQILRLIIVWYQLDSEHDEEGGHTLEMTRTGHELSCRGSFV